MASCGKSSTVSLQKHPSSISSHENILRYEVQISVGKIACKVQETWKKNPSTFLFFLLLCSSLSLVFSANSLFFYTASIYFEIREFVGRGVREGPKAAVLFGLSSVQGTTAGQALQVSCMPLLQPCLFTGEPSTKHLVPSAKDLVPSTYARMQVPVCIFLVRMFC